VNDPHGNGVKGYTVSNCKTSPSRSVPLRSSLDVTVSNTDGFTSRNIKLISRKAAIPRRRLRPDWGSKHILIENGFAMTMDDAFAFYGGAAPASNPRCGEGILDYGYTSALVLGVMAYPGGQARALRGCTLRFDSE